MVNFAPIYVGVVRSVATWLMLHVMVVILKVRNWLICLMEHKSPELLKAAPKNLLSKPVPLYNNKNYTTAPLV